MTNSLATPSQGALTCAFCKQPIAGAYYQFGARPCCERCAAQLGQIQQKNQFDLNDWMLGGLLGLAAAIGGGVVWAYIAKEAKGKFGIVAVGIGWLVCKAVRKGSRDRRGPAMQGLAIGLAILGILTGELLLPVLLLTDRQVSPLRAVVTVIHILLTKPMLFFDFYDLIWVVIAVLAPIRLFRPHQIDLKGPFTPGTGAPSGALQFDRIEPPTTSGAA